MIIKGFYIFFLVMTALIFGQHFWRGKTLNLSQVKKKWGHTELNLEEFKKGEEKVRGKMAYSVLFNKQKFIGKHVLEIRKLFGDPDGYYFADIFPAYMIHRDMKDEDSWQIVFLLNEQRNVTDVIVHKNCCD